MTTLPPATITVTVEDLSVDRLCFEYALELLGDRRQAGRLRGYVEATLAANPGLSALGAVLPRGTVVRLPSFTPAGPAGTIRLWD